jgi:acyl-CoA reductase-like NAD-dependent aldehyde dehydrogenase
LLKHITLELGSNDTTIVCDNVDVASVARHVAQGCLFHSGQMFVAIKRVYIHTSIYPQFFEVLVKEFEFVKTSTSEDTPSTFGHPQNNMQFCIVEDYIENCKAHGYRIATGGMAEDGPGLWIQPTIVDRPTDDSLIVSGEQFGKFYSRKSFCV